MDKEIKVAIFIALPIAVLLVGFGLFVAYVIPYCEITTQQYEKIRVWTDEDPLLKPFVETKMKDGKITEAEIHEIWKERCIHGGMKAEPIIKRIEMPAEKPEQSF